MKQYFLFTLLLLQSIFGFAQAPNKMSYQAVIRNSNNTVVSNHAVGMRISILQGTATGSSVYTENQSPTTNANGLIAIEIGTGTIVSGSFANIDWANGPYFVKTETDPNGGNNYTLTGTSQLLSVPYALYAKTADNSNSSKKSDTAKVALNGVPSGSQHGQTLMNCDGDIVWTFNGQCPAKIAGFNCTDTIHVGELFFNAIASAPSCSTNCIYSTMSYFGGNGGIYSTQIVASSGVLGLTAELSAGNLNIGNGILRFIIKGIPTSSGIASFTFTIGNKTCTLYRSIINSPFPASTVFCNGRPTSVFEVTNPITGKIWMDRNLGAIRAATSSNDEDSYGDLYQWGRAADGHQCRNSLTTTSLSTSAQPGHNNYILTTLSPLDWLISQNDSLWQGLNSINNPCPFNYRLPTISELDTEKQTWNPINNIGAFNSPLKFPMSGYRHSGSSGTIFDNGVQGLYWSSNVYNKDAKLILINNTNVNSVYLYRGTGMSVRCIKD